MDFQLDLKIEKSLDRTYLPAQTIEFNVVICIKFLSCAHTQTHILHTHLTGKKRSRARAHTRTHSIETETKNNNNNDDRISMGDDVYMLLIYRHNCEYRISIFIISNKTEKITHRERTKP